MIWQLKVEEEAICQHIYNLCTLGMLKCSLLMEHFNFVSVDITNGLFHGVVFRLHGSSRSQLGVKSIPTIDEL